MTKRPRRSSPRRRHRLAVQRFAQVERAELAFGDLTVLVGQQGSGKSLLLQWLKLALDRFQILEALEEAGEEATNPDELLDIVFGQGMSSAWSEQTKVKFNGRAVSRSTGKQGIAKRPGSVFFVPAHRSLLLAEGWPAPFQRLGADVPVVARLFSQALYEQFSGLRRHALFPDPGRLKKEYRTLIDDAVFHGGKVGLEKEGTKRRLRLEFKDASLPYMTWTAGQREFTPLLLGLYGVFPAAAKRKVAEVEWVVIEEPEMGLHPKATSVVMLLVLDLLWRGYRVVVSTHSPVVLEAVWAIREIAGHRGRWQRLAEAFGVEQSGQIRKVLLASLRKDFRVYCMDLTKGGGVVAHGISALDPGSEKPMVAEWGGLTGFSTAFGEAVRRSANERFWTT